jgi:hypothetical protein
MVNLYNRVYYYTHQEKMKQYAIDFYKRNKERLSAERKLKRMNNLDLQRHKDRMYYHNNKDKYNTKRTKQTQIDSDIKIFYFKYLKHNSNPYDNNKIKIYKKFIQVEWN